MSQKIDPPNLEAKRISAAFGLDGDHVPHGMGRAEQLERAVMREDGIGAHRRSDEERIRAETARRDAWRHAGVDPPRHRLEASCGDVVAEPLHRAPVILLAESPAGLLQAEHRIPVEEGLCLHLTLR
jgi:hypothetical protein